MISRIPLENNPIHLVLPFSQLCQYLYPLFQIQCRLFFLHMQILIASLLAALQLLPHCYQIHQYYPLYPLLYYRSRRRFLPGLCRQPVGNNGGGRRYAGPDKGAERGGAANPRRHGRAVWV